MATFQSMGRGEDARHGVPESTHSPRVLVVDDDENLTRLVSIILRTANYEVLTASDGYEALDVASSEPVDLIYLDLRMPKLDGRGFFRELRARGDETPVLVVSAFDARRAQVELGAEGSIAKPFDPDGLVEAVTRLLAQRA